MKAKQMIPFLCAAALATAAAQNPVSPPGVYLADPSARVMPDGKLYLFGSNDESTDYYCSNVYHLLSTSDLKDWQTTKHIFTLDPRRSPDSANARLYAPDAMEKDGRYRLYYCLSRGAENEWVAFADNPRGPFGDERPVAGVSGIDPAVFTDDDGQSYYYWGQFNARGARLRDDGTAIDPASVNDRLLTEREHRFHEGGWMFKRRGVYYFVYTSLSERGEATTIGYSTSDSPLGPFAYRGTIIDNFGCDPKSWNNHGSVVEYQGQWYVFYHRSTHASKAMRKACVEKIRFNDDGSIPQVEMTSQGAADPLDAFAPVEAERACLLGGDARITSPSAGAEELSGIEHYNTATYKYLDFPRAPRRITVRLSSLAGGQIHLYTNDMFRAHAILRIPPGDGKTPSDYSAEVANLPPGIHPLRFRFIGEEGRELMRIDRFQFE
jgi:beta-xylosidase